jgi:ElaB/YqjD/DUF883 family membrane-anchored ribosome-binding protein
MSHTSNHMARTARKAASDVREAAEESKNIMQDVGSDLLHAAKKAGTQAKEAVQEGWDQLRNTAGDYVEQGRDRVMEMEHSVEQRIQSRPFMSLFVALGLGFFVGWLCRRSR